MATPERQHPDDTHGVYDPNSEYANTKPDLQKLEGGGQTSAPKRGHLHSANDKDSKDEVGEDKHLSKEAGSSKSESPESLKDSEENGSLFKSEDDGDEDSGGDFGYRNEKRGGRGSLKGKAKGLLKKKWLIVGGVGGGGIVLALVILFLILGSLAIPNFAQDLVAWQFARVTREVVDSNTEVTSEKVAIDSSSDAEYKTILGKYKGKLLDSVNKYNPEKVVQNLKAEGQLSYEYGPESKILHRRSIVKIISNGTTIDVPQNSTTALEKISSPLDYTKSLFQAKSQLKTTLADSMDQTVRGTNFIIRGEVAKKIRSDLSIHLFRWSKTDIEKFNGENEATADLDNGKISYNETTNSGAAATDAEKGSGKGDPALNDDEQQAAKLESACVSDPKCLADNIKTGGGTPTRVLNYLNGAFSSNAFDSILKFISPTYALGIPLCMIYEGSIVNSGPSVDANSAEDQRTFYSVASAGDQQKDGTNVDGEAVGALQRQLQPIDQSNAQMRSSGLPVDTSASGLSPQAGAGGSYNSDIIKTVLPEPFATVFSGIASSVCPIITNPASALAGLAFSATPEGLSTAAALKAGETTIKELLDQAIKSTFEKLIDKQFYKGLKGPVLKGAAGVGATVGAALLAKVIVLNHVGSLNSGLSRGTTYANQADAGGNLAAQQIDQQGNYGAPMTNAQVALSRISDQDYLNKQNESKSAYQRYLAFDNPASLVDKIGMGLSSRISFTTISSSLGSISNLFNPMFVFSKVFGSMEAGKASVAAASTVDNGDYGIVQWGWTNEEETAYNSPSYSMLDNQKILDNSHQEANIAKKYGKCFTSTMGTLLQDGDIQRDDNGNITGGLCSPAGLGIANCDFRGSDGKCDGGLVFRWRVAQRNQATVNQFLDTQQATPIT